MKKNILWAMVLLISLFFVNSFAVGITFTFANTQITGSSPQYFEFDVMVAADASGTKIGDTQVYINYNIDGFGTNITGANGITVTKGSFIDNINYRLPVVADNTTSRVSITTEFQGLQPSDGSDLPTVPTQLLHVIIEIKDETQTAGLSFQQNDMDGAQFQSDGSTQYEPVNAVDTNDSSLPVELASFIVDTSEGDLVLQWVTESEINNLGFEIWRSWTSGGNFEFISGYLINPGLVGQGNSNIRHEYRYEDKTVEPGNKYWYKLADVDFNGVRTYHAPISVEVPKASNIPSAFKLYSGYPNPFNPSTTLRFNIPQIGAELVDSKLVIYNSLGQEVKTLYQGKVGPGSYEVKWDGTTDLGSKAPSGIYFVVFRADVFFQTQRLILLK